MKFSKLTAVVLASGLVLVPTSSIAQDDGEVEQGIGKLLKKVACKAGPDLLNGIPYVGGALKGAAKKKCDKSAATNKPAAANQSPALQAQLFKVVTGPAGGQVTITDATPDTSYAQGEGLAIVLSHNSSGYLEVWSVDANSATMVEAMVLPNKAGTIVLPKQSVGYYKMNTSGGTDKLRFRFLPCAPSEQHSFGFESNASVVNLSGQEAVAVNALAAKLPSCPFDDNINKSIANDSLFEDFNGVRAEYSVDLGAYTAISKTGGAIQFDITLKRN